MVLERFPFLFNRTDKLRKYNNVMEAAHWARTMLKLSGTIVFELKVLPGNLVTSNFTVLGFTFYIVWFVGYLYCSYKTHDGDQTILRIMHDTKLQRYGDDFERISSTIFVIITLILTPFRLNGNAAMIQKIIDIDVVIEKAGDIIDYNKLGQTAFSLSIGQTIVYIIRLVCIYMALNSSISMPIEKVFQVCMSDALAVITTSLYCYHLKIHIERFKWINKTLSDIKEKKSWEYKVFVRGKVPANMIKVVELQDRHVCEKIKTCARVYSMLFDSCKWTSCLFGLSLLFTLLHYFNYIILYLFYFMEANATGLFHDLERYFKFLVYSFWEIAIALGIVFMVIVFSEITVVHVSIILRTIYCT